MFPPILEVWDADLSSGDPLDFPGYADALADLSEESVRTGLADGYVVVEGVFDAFGGSMGLVHGERVVRAFDRATQAGLPVVVITRSGGARMQEGMVSLVQLSRTAAAVERHRAAGLLSISVLCSPTTGGVLASYGSLTDLRVAEAGALIGFAGPRVVAETTGEEVGGRSHTAEHALAHGLVDAVVPADDLAGWALGALGRADRPLVVPDPVPADGGAGDGDGSPAWRQVRRARAAGRPTGVHHAAAVTTSWTELGAGVDPTVRAGLATIGAHRVVVVASDRHAADGRPTPAGFRLAQRAIALADRLGLPVVTFVDTPGAAAGADAENEGVAGEIARTFAALLTTSGPTLSVCVGEGGSGGALALACADLLWVQEGAVFSVIGPEGAAAILRHDADAAPAVAELLALCPDDLVRLGIVDAVVPDGLDAVAAAVGDALDRLAAEGGGGRRLSRFDDATAAWLRTDRGAAPQS